MRTLALLKKPHCNWRTDTCNLHLFCSPREGSHFFLTLVCFPSPFLGLDFSSVLMCKSTSSPPVNIWKEEPKVQMAFAQLSHSYSFSPSTATHTEYCRGGVSKCLPTSNYPFCWDMGFVCWQREAGRGGPVVSCVGRSHFKLALDSKESGINSEIDHTLLRQWYMPLEPTPTPTVNIAMFYLIH